MMRGDAVGRFNSVAPVQFVFFIVGVGLFFVGGQREAPAIAMLGLLPIGFAIILRGIHVMRTRRDVQRDADYTHPVRTYSGNAAYLRGLMAVLTGLFLMAIGALPIFNLEDALANFVANSPAAIPLIIGVVLVFTLLPQLVGSDQMMSKNIISRLIERVFILFFLVIGVILLVFGFLQATDPPAAEAFYREGVQMLPDDIQQQVEAWNLYDRISQPPASQLSPAQSPASQPSPIPPPES
jgi:hypothetical protein